MLSSTGEIFLVLGNTLVSPVQTPYTGVVPQFLCPQGTPLQSPMGLGALYIWHRGPQSLLLNPCSENENSSSAPVQGGAKGLLQQTGARVVDDSPFN